MMRFIRWLQGERKGMGSQFKPPTAKQKTESLFYPSIAIPNVVLLADVSFYQGEINFAAMKAAGISGVILRAGQRTWVDAMYAVNQAAAKAVGLLRGAYWFYDGREEPKRQAALWWSVVKDTNLELFYVPDMEDRYGGAYANRASRKLFVAEFQRLSGASNKQIVIYSGFYWWNENMGNDAFFRSYCLWLAWYSPEAVVRVPAPWLESDLILWQYTSAGDGLKYGVTSKEIDLDWYNGDVVKFTNEYGGGVPDPPPGGIMRFYELSGSLYLRSNEDTSGLGNVVGGVMNGDIAEVDFISVLGWGRVVGIKRAGAVVALPQSATGVWLSLNTTYTKEVFPPVVPPVTPPASVFVSLSTNITADVDGKLYGVTITDNNVELLPK